MLAHHDPVVVVHLLSGLVDIQLERVRSCITTVSFTSRVGHLASESVFFTRICSSRVNGLLVDYISEGGRRLSKGKGIHASQTDTGSVVLSVKEASRFSFFFSEPITRFGCIHQILQIIEIKDLKVRASETR